MLDIDNNSRNHVQCVFFENKIPAIPHACHHCALQAQHSLARWKPWHGDCGLAVRDATELFSLLSAVGTGSFH